MFKQRVTIEYDKYLIQTYFQTSHLNSKGEIFENGRITAKVKEIIRDKDNTLEFLTTLQLCEKILKELHPYCFRVDITRDGLTSSYEK